MRAERDGCTLNKVELYSRPDVTSIDEIVSNVELALTPKTRVLALTWVHSSTGVKLPVREIADVVAHANRDRGLRERILFCLDGVHGFGCRGRDARRARRRLPRQRLPQVAVRPARHRARLGHAARVGRGARRRSRRSTSSSTSRGCTTEPTAVPRRAARDARRLPLDRAPLGADGGVRMAAGARAARGRAADARARRAPEGPGSDGARHCSSRRRATRASRPGW